MTTKKNATTEMRRCIGSKTFGIEPHEAPVADFPVQPSRKDGLGLLCRTHWRQYTSALRKAANARKAAELPEHLQNAIASAEAAGAKVSITKRKARRATAPLMAHIGKAPEEPTPPIEGETTAVTARRRGFEKRLAKLGVRSDTGQKMLADAAKGETVEEVDAA